MRQKNAAYSFREGARCKSCGKEGDMWYRDNSYDKSRQDYGCDICGDFGTTGQLW